MYIIAEFLPAKAREKGRKKKKRYPWKQIKYP